jgi:2-acylglycerol O-acyltransferase 2
MAAVRCEDAPFCQAHAAASVPSPELAAKPRASNSDGSGGVARTALAVAGALACWSILVAAWAASIMGPVVLVVAAATARWRLVGALCAATALPHIVPIPRIPGACEVLVRGIFRWVGPPGTVRFVDYSRPASSGEPEPEPLVAGDADRQLFCYHPHGIYTLGCLKIAAERPDVTVLSSPFLYHFAPVFRFIVGILKGENFGSVGRKDLMNIMKKGRTPLMLVPGGFHEATIVCPGTERVYLKNRKGFVKYALRHGYDLVPCYTIGESDLMANPQGAWGFRFFMNALSLPAVLPWGFPLLPLLPRRGVEMVTTIGPPVKVPRIRNPTDEDVKEYHKRYMAALQELYDRAKVGTASESRKLEIW